MAGNQISRITIEELRRLEMHCNSGSSLQYNKTSKLARANSAARFDKVILIYDLLFIYLKSLTLIFM
jgi:hypothetical protein